MGFQFLCDLEWFLQIQSHILTEITKYFYIYFNGVAHRIMIEMHVNHAMHTIIIRQWLFVRSCTNISVLFIRSRTNISVLFVRSRTNSFVLFVQHSVQIPSCLYTGQAAQLICPRAGDREVPGSVPMDYARLVVISLHRQETLFPLLHSMHSGCAARLFTATMRVGHC